MAAWLGLIGAILGAVIGWGLSETSKATSERRQALRNLESAAFVCLARLLKIQSANDRSNKKQTCMEIWNLGEDLDRYRDAIAATRQHRRAHWKLYRQTMPLLLEHNLNNLSQLITRYEKESGAAAANLSSNLSLDQTS